MPKTDRPALTLATARKSLGQHFLFDPDILNRAALAAGPVASRVVIEIGPGPGGLTRSLLELGAEKLIAIEADQRFANALSEWPEAQTGRLQIIQGDARKVSIPDILGADQTQGPVMIISNLPYNIGTVLLTHWLKAGDWRGEMALMFQKEVALRICALPGEAHYGRLAILTGASMQAHISFTLPPGAFRPPPKVDSAVVAFIPLAPDKRFTNMALLETLTRHGFGQRRKMLRSSLKPFVKAQGIALEPWLDKAGIDPTARAETVDIQAWCRLAETCPVQSVT